MYDVELLAITLDEADQGYYEDDAIGPGDFERLRENVGVKFRRANGGKGEVPEGAGGGEGTVLQPDRR